jgi:DNA processing protein
VTVLGVGAGGPILGSGPTDPSDLGVEERDAWAILAGVDGLGPVGFAALLGHFGSGREILRVATGPRGVHELASSVPQPSDDRPGPRPIPIALATAIAEAANQGERALERIRALGLSVVTVADPRYPMRLAAIDLPPHLLFVRGDIGTLEPRHAVALVGTRRPSPQGRALAARIASALAASQATVVSGLAVGIDGAAHDATLSVGGRTIAVIGGGHASLYPRAHRALADAIVAGGGAVVSELAPDVASTKGTFPRRNRVISGLSDAVVVVEAPARSGALITASWALEQGRECFLVPGAIGALESEGCLAFLREFPGGARIVAGVPQLLDDLGLVQGSRARPLAAGTLTELGPTPRLIAAGLLDGLATVDELVAATALPVATILATLTILERDGLAFGVHGRYRPAGTLAVQPLGSLRRARRLLARTHEPMLP